MEKVKLTDICSPKQWKTIPTEQLTEDGYPVYGANGIIGKYSEYNHANPVIAITCRGATCGNINITQEKAYVTGNAMCLDDLCSDVDLEYLFYALRHYDFSTVISGSAQPQITRQGLSKVSIQLFPFDQQKFIAKTLAKAERIISHRRTQLAKLDELIKCRFVEMFGALSKYIEMPLKDVCSFIDYRGKTPIKTEYGIPLITAKNVGLGVYSWNPREYIDETIYDSWMTRGIPRVGDILFTTEAPLGHVCRIPEMNGCFSVGQRLIVIQPDPLLLDYDYVSFILQSHNFQEKVLQKSTGSTVKGIRSKELIKLSIPIPPLTLQQNFATVVQRIDKLRFIAGRKKSFEHFMNK